MKVIPLVVLYVSLAICDQQNSQNCNRNCEEKYGNVTLVDACKLGCRYSTGLNATTDEYNVNLDCENSCNVFEIDAAKSACYGGCTYISAVEVESPLSLIGFLKSPIMSRILKFFNLNEEAVDPPVSIFPPVKETHIRIFFTDGLADEPNLMEDENMRLMMNVMHDPEVEPTNDFRVVQMSSPVHSVGAPDFARQMCFRARAAFHHLTSHPLFLALVVLMFVISVTLLILTCCRLSARRARRASFQGQYSKMPALFKTPSMQVNLLTLQPSSEDDEAPELPPKEPIV